MQKRIATTYDQNPARIRLVANRSLKQNMTVLKTFMGIKLAVGLLAIYCLNYLPV